MPNISSQPFRKIRRPVAYSLRRMYFTNLVLLGFLGVLVCGWILYFSDWFEVVGGLLALGGAFTWLAFVLKIIREDRIHEMQGWIEKRILGRKLTRVVLLSVIFVGIVLSQLLGTIQVDLYRESVDRDVFIYELDKAKPDPMRLPAGRSLRVVRWTNWFGTKYLVKVSGYPDRVELLYPLWRTELRVPTSFRRQVFFVRPSADVSEKIHAEAQTLMLTVEHSNGQKYASKIAPIPYRGQAFWIGCDDDVEVPQVLQEQWVPGLQQVQRLELVNEWRRPVAIAPGVKLEKGDQVKVELKNDAGTVWVLSQPGFQDPVTLVTEQILYEK